MDDESLSQGMDERENTTSIKNRAGSLQSDTIQLSKSLIRFVTLIPLVAACYVLVPLGLHRLGTILQPHLGNIAEIVVLLIGVVAMWLGPNWAAFGVLGVTAYLFSIEFEDLEADWTLGILVGTMVLTAVWFFPFWHGIWPSGANLLQPLRIAELADSSVLIVISWILSVPMMFAVGFGTMQEDDANSSSVERTSISHTNGVNDMNNQNQASDSFSSCNLTFPWENPPETTFVDVGGMEETIEEVRRSVIAPLASENTAYKRFGVSPPNGVLLYGPPGTGKTHFARAVAGELGQPYLELSAGDFKSKWINESTENVNRLFREAAQFDRCVIFIDEIDAVLTGREGDLHHSHAQVVNEFLSHLDEEHANFLVIAATNRVDMLDEAALRRGRFDQQFEVGLPDRDAREEIFWVRLRRRPNTLDEADYSRLAEASEGLTSADIVGVVEDAAMRAAERDAEAITAVELFESIPRGSDE